MEDKHSHNEVMNSLTEILKVTEGINARLDKLNGSVAKHADKFATQEVMNAQTTMSQQQIVSDLAIIKDKEEKASIFMYEARGSIGTFKWLIGLIGMGTLLTILKTFF